MTLCSFLSFLLKIYSQYQIWRIDHIIDKRRGTWSVTGTSCDYHVTVLYYMISLSARAHAEMHLRGKQDGTFLCRPSGKAMQNAKGGLHTHTIDIV